MQHHTHAPRAQLHMRGHHLQSVHTTVGGVGAPTMHITPIALCPAQPQPQPQTQPQTNKPRLTQMQQNQLNKQTLTNQQQLQMQVQPPPTTPQLQHHLKNLTATAATTTATQNVVPHNLREQCNRINHQNSLHSTTQTQKIRPQHQQINNINNIQKINHQQLHHHQYNQPQHMAAATQHLQPQPHIRHISVHAHHTQQTQLQQQQQQQPSYRMPHVNTHIHANKQQQQQPQVLTTNNAQNHIRRQPQYYSGNKPKYNNNNAGYVPKQYTHNHNPNPNRLAKTRTQAATTTTTTTTTNETPANVTNVDAHKPDIANANTKKSDAVTSSNIIVITPDDNITPDNNTPATTTNVNTAAATETNAAVTVDDNLSPVSQSSSDDSLDSNKENLAYADDQHKENNNNNNFSNNNHSNGNNINILSDEDTSPSKNSKDKTPMCLVNELARYNKITHQYRLTNEKGPPHCKRFQVTLKLGDEEYSAEGFKIKKAQHMAAAEAIEKTKYKHPTPKVNRRPDDAAYRAAMTPTVELNALAMKLGQQTYYLFDPRQSPTITPLDTMVPQADAVLPHGFPPRPRIVDPTYMPRGAFVPTPMTHTNHRYNVRGYPPKFHPRYPNLPIPHTAYTPHNFPCKITLIVGKQKFVGTGRTVQQAKHDAASRALQVLRAQATVQLNDELNGSLEDNEIKSPISLVHEIGIKRNMNILFKVLREEGPAHMKNYITACIVGTIVTEGEGNGKKISKKRAAEKMLDELKKLPPLTPSKASPVKRLKIKPSGKQANGNAAATDKHNAGGGNEKRKRAGFSLKKNANVDMDAENPITKLIQMQQSRKEKEPIFELVAKNDTENARRSEFIMEVGAQGVVARGTGSSKKLAKRNAAQNLLTALAAADSNAMDTTTHELDAGKNDNAAKAEITTTVSDKTAQDANTKGKAENVAATTATKTTENDKPDVPKVSTTAGEVPGILILRQNKKHTTKKKDHTAGAAVDKKDTKHEEKINKTETNLKSDSTTKAKENNTSKSAEKTTATSTAEKTDSSSSGGAVSLKDQLLYLANLLGFEVDFSHYPKGNHEEYLTIVTLSTSPPQICHGTGVSCDESQNDASKNALKILSELGLNIAKK